MFLKGTKLTVLSHLLIMITTGPGLDYGDNGTAVEAAEYSVHAGQANISGDISSKRKRALSRA